MNKRTMLVVLILALIAVAAWVVSQQGHKEHGGSPLGTQEHGGQERAKAPAR